MKHPLSTLALSTLLIGLSAGTALAQAPSAQKAPASAQEIALAESAYNDGIKLAQAGNCKEAVEKLELSQKIDPASGTAVNLAKCYEQLGRTASAYGAYSAAVGLARERANEERRKEAEQRMAELAPLLAKVEIRIATPPNGLSIAIDGKVINAQALGVGIPVDPGTRTIEVSAPGKKPWKTTVLVASTPGTTPVAVPPLEDLPVEPTGMPTGAKVAVVGLAGVGAVLLGVGIGFGVDALDKNAASKKLCLPEDPNKCSAAGVEMRDQAFSSATVSNVGVFGGGVALVAAGSVLLVSRFVLQKPATPAAKNDVALTTIGIGPGGVSLQGRW